MNLMIIPGFRSVAAFVVALTMFGVCSVVPQARAQNPNLFPPAGALPDSLPIGDELTIRNWIVSTNGSIVNQFISASHPFMVFIDFFRLDGIEDYTYIQDNTYGYSSYNDYVHSEAVGAMILLNRMLTNPAYHFDPSRPIYYIPDVGYHFPTPSISFDGFTLRTNIGLASQITTNTFLDSIPLTLSPDVEFVVMQMPGLSYVRIDADTPVPSWYVWTNNTFSCSDSWKLYRPTNETDYTQSGYLVLSRWLDLARFRLRVTLIVNGEKAVYTQYGDKILPPVLSIQPDTTVTVNAARGSDVTIYQSPDANAPPAWWTVKTSFTSSARVKSIPMSANAPHMFYRASIR